MGPGLLALRAPDGASVTLERYPILVGRLNPGGPVPDVDLSHLDPGEAVDSHHCELTEDDEGVEVHDLGGVSGTWVDGRRLPPGGRARLRLGGTLRVAGVSLTLVAAPARRPFAPPPVPPPAAAWRAAGSPHPAPPPPSAIVMPEVTVPPPRAELDLSGAPPSARSLLEAGAEAVRLEPGFPLRALRGDLWDPVGEPVAMAVKDLGRTRTRGERDLVRVTTSTVPPKMAVRTRKASPSRVTSTALATTGSPSRALTLAARSRPSWVPGKSTREGWRRSIREDTTCAAG